MGIAHFLLLRPRGAALALLLLLACSPARGGNVTYPFNASDGGWTVTGTGAALEKPWTWQKGPSSSAGGWQSFLGANDSPGSGTYLQSPCLEIDDVDGQYVRVDISHRFNFSQPFSFQDLGAGIPNALGQVQYRVDAGSGWGNWLGVPTAVFKTTSGNIPPTYPTSGTLAPPLIPTATYPVASATTVNLQAWAGTTPDFATGKHQPSEFTLDFASFGLAPKNEIQFRFLMAPQAAPTNGLNLDSENDKVRLNWEINKVQIDGVLECPEPGTLALAATGLIAGLGYAARRRRLRRALAGAIVLAALAGIHGSASAEITSTFNFNLTSGSFTASPQGIYSTPPITQRWTYRVAGPNSDPYLSGTSTLPTWNVRSSPVSGTAVATGNYLTSPLIQLGATVDQFILRVAQRYRLPGNGASVPIDVGQITYSIDGAVFLPLAANQWKSGTVDASLQPYVTPSNWSSLAVPTFVPGVGSTPPVYLLKDGGASFTGETAGFDAGNFAGSETLTVKFPQATQTVEFRFANVNLGNNCGINGGWDLAFVEATFIEAPEPGAFALAAVGGVLSSLGWIGRGCRGRWRRSITSDPPARA